MTRYMLFSSTFHFFALLTLFVLQKNTRPPNNVYYIDFVGKAEVMNASDINRRVPARKKKPEKKEPAKKEKKASPSGPAAKKAEPPPEEENFILPSPSMLGATDKLFENLKNLVASKEKSEKAQEAGTEEESPETGVSASFSNFPYPWYISKVRQRLSGKWSAKMPDYSGVSAVVRFEIGKSGGISGVKLTASSGNPLFDMAAVNSVRECASFDELPPDFADDELVVYVKFKTLK